MKKLLTAVLCAALFAAVTVCAACVPQDSSKSGEIQPVTLVALSGATEVVANDEIDYFVVPEPAASLRIKATSASEQKLNMVGDLQNLYGGDSGYPQAVVVAKNSLFESKAVPNFVEALKRNTEWLADENTQIQTVVDAVSSHLTEGMEPSLKTANLTKQVIGNCSIRYASAADSKDETKAFLTALKAVQPSVNDSPEDKFFWNGSAPETESALEEISVYAPDGAPALALAGLMSGDVKTEGVAATVNYNIVDATTIQTFVTGESPKADICILPVNLAANVLGNGNSYTMFGTVTHGNLFILSAKTNEAITSDNISSLAGKTVGVVNLAAVPGLTFKLILNKFNVGYTDPAQA